MFTFIYSTRNLKHVLLLFTITTREEAITSIQHAKTDLTSEIAG